MKYEIDKVSKDYLLVKKLSYSDLFDTKFSVQSKSVTFYAEILKDLTEDRDWHSMPKVSYQSGDVVVVNNDDYVYLDHLDLYIVPVKNIVAKLKVKK